MRDTNIKKTDPDKKYRSVLAASTLAGDKVRNPAGEDLGRVDELMINIPEGRVEYAVLSFGGMLRMGSKLFAVPWSALTVDEDEQCFILDADQETLERAPGFDKENWPDMADPNWGSSIYRHFDATREESQPVWEERSQSKPLRGGGDL